MSETCQICGAARKKNTENHIFECGSFFAGVFEQSERCRIAELEAENAELKADNERMQAVNVSLAERVAKQSDLLSKNAERAAIDAAKRQQETPGQSGSLPEKTPISP